MHTFLLAALLLADLAHATIPPRPCGIVVPGPHAEAPPSAVCPQLPRHVVVRTYDGVGVSAGQRRLALATASDLLASSGLPVIFVLCPRAGTNGRSAGCHLPLRPDGELILRLSRSTPANPADALGFSFFPGVVATALVDRVQSSAWRNRVEVSRMLGAVIAHEIVHLLRGDAHSGSGIMRAVWLDREIRSSQGALVAR